VDGDDHGRHHGRGDSDDLVPGVVVDDAVLGLTDGRAFLSRSTSRTSSWR
jgi:hypothetical protein